MQKISMIAIFLATSLLSTYFIPVFADEYILPTTQEKQLFKKLLAEFKNLKIEKKDVGEVLDTFEKPLIISFPCDSIDQNNQVISVIKTKLASFDKTQTREDGIVTGGRYTWKCYVTSVEGKITIDCDNEQTINPDYVLYDLGKDPRIKKIENLVMIYNGFLHGQLMIDAIESSEKWRDDTCNKPPEGKIDYSYSDKDNKIINPLQKEFTSQLIEQAGGKFIVKEVTVSETNEGSFSKKVASLNDFPQFIESGINVSLRGTNLIDTTFSSQDSDIILHGNLIDKTEPGIAWLYIFGMNTDGPVINQLTETKTQTPNWIKKIFDWYDQDKISEEEVNNAIKFLVKMGIVDPESNNLPTLKKTSLNMR